VTTIFFASSSKTTLPMLVTMPCFFESALTWSGGFWSPESWL
jgi:hypothetical protein